MREFTHPVVRVSFNLAMFRLLKSRSETCLICGNRIDPRVELPLVAQESCGIVLNEVWATKYALNPHTGYHYRFFERDHDYVGYEKIIDIPEGWLTVYGSAPMWNEDVLKAAAHLIRQGVRPWFCCRCAGQVCPGCDTPFDLPFEADYLDQHLVVHKQDSRLSRRIRCLNEECEYFRPWEDDEPYAEWRYLAE